MKESRHMFETCACTRIRTVARLVTKAYDDALRATGLKTSQVAVLAAVDALEAPSIAALSKALFMDRTTLTRNLRPLMALSLITLQEDGRSKITLLTPKGERSLKEALPLWQQAQKDFGRRLKRHRLEPVEGHLHSLISSY